MEDDDDDTRSVATATSELSPNVPFTQEQVDAVRGFVQATHDMDELKKQSRELSAELKKHREVLVELLKSRKKTKLKLDDQLKIELVQTSVQKKPPGTKMFEMIGSVLRGEPGDTYTRILNKLEKSIKEGEVTVEREKLVLDGPGKKKKRQAAAS